MCDKAISVFAVVVVFCWGVRAESVALRVAVQQQTHGVAIIIIPSSEHKHNSIVFVWHSIIARDSVEERRAELLFGMASSTHRPTNSRCCTQNKKNETASISDVRDAGTIRSSSNVAVFVQQRDASSLWVEPRCATMRATEIRTTADKKASVSDIRKAGRDR